MSNRASKWLNKDGLYVGHGTRKSESNSAPQVSTMSVEQELRMAIKGAELNDVATGAEVENGAVIPAGAFLLSATLYVNTAFAGTNAVLDLGIWDQDAGEIENDAGIDAAVAVTALDAEGDTITADGALIGTVLAQNSKVIASYDTAAFTAGEGTLVVKYLMPTA